MGKKSKKQRNVLRDTLSRLATTVKADAPTLVLGAKTPANSAGKLDAKKDQAPRVSAISRLSQRLNPFGAQRAADRRSKKQLKKIAQQMASHGAVAKPRRSRLPYVVAFGVMMLAFGGYKAYQAIEVPVAVKNFQLSDHVNYKTWLDTVSGHAGPSGVGEKNGAAKVVAKKKSPKRKDAAKVGAASKKKATKVASSKDSRRKVAASPKAASSKKIVASQAKKTKVVAKNGSSSRSKKAVAPSTMSDKKFKKLSQTEKERIWKAKLAKLRQQSDAKYRKASHRRGE